MAVLVAASRTFVSRRFWLLLPPVPGLSRAGSDVLLYSHPALRCISTKGLMLYCSSRTSRSTEVPGLALVQVGMALYWFTLGLTATKGPLGPFRYSSLFLPSIHSRIAPSRYFVC